MTNEINDNKRMNRGRFLGFLGKVGVLTLLTSIPVFGAEAKLRAVKRVQESEGEAACGSLVERRLRYTDILRSPTIKGKTLSRNVLQGKLKTKNLENIRDILTGRFFGRAAEDAIRSCNPLDGIMPFITWNLGSNGSDLGCFLNACVSLTLAACPDLSNGCTFQMISHEERDRLIIDVMNSSGVGDFINRLDCNNYCSGQCSPEGGCGHKCDERCSPKGTINLGELVSYPTDKFASELLEILGSTDVGVIQRELRDVIFSDDVLNMGLQHIVLAAHDSMAGALGGMTAGH
jgi:hypothetical protein